MNFVKWVNTALSNLCKKSLRLKWNYDERDSKIDDFCPFCYHCDHNCNECICPPEICAKHASEGYISEISEDYGEDTTIYCISDYEIEHMRELFKKYIL